jgi:hypothetical protein
MVHISVEFLEARKMVEKWSQPWRWNPAFSSGAENLRGYFETNMSNFAPFKMPRRRKEWDNIETSESIKSQASRSDGTGEKAMKVVMDSSRTEISEPSPSNIEKKTQFKGPDSAREIFRRDGAHSDGGRSQEHIGDDNQLSDKLRES